MKKFRQILPVAAALLLTVGNLVLVAPVSAAPLSQTYLRLNRMATGQSNGGNATNYVRLVFKATSAGATSLSVNMNGADSTNWTGSGGSVVNSSTTVTTATCASETGFTALPGTLTASGNGTSLSISGITALSAGSTYCVDFTGTAVLANPTAAGEYHPVVTVGSDSVTIAERIVTNDQIVVTAVVPPTFNFALTTNTDTFGTLSAAAVTASSGVTATVNTNAKNGWVAWIKDANSGLSSASATKTIASTTAGSAATLTTTAEGYSVGGNVTAQGSGGGTSSMASAYGGSNGGGVDPTLRPFASSNGTAGNATMNVKEYVNVLSTTPAATDYTDTITLVGAGSF